MKNIKEIVGLYLKDQLSASAVARKVGSTHSTILNKLHCLGLETRNKNAERIHLDRKAVLLERSKGKSIRKLSKIFGISQTPIRKILFEKKENDYSLKNEERYIITLYKNGFKKNILADIFQIEERRIEMILRKKSIPELSPAESVSILNFRLSKKRRLPKVSYETLSKYLKEKPCSIKQIASRLKSSYSYIAKRIHDEFPSWKSPTALKTDIRRKTEMEALSAYLSSKISVSEVARIFSLKETSFHRTINEAGIKKRTLSDLRTIVNLPEKTIIRKYLQGRSLFQLSKQFDLSPTPIKHILKKNGIIIRPQESYIRARKYPINLKRIENKIFTPSFLWFFGWLLSDGSISKYRLSICVKVSDKYILERMKKILKTDNPLYLGKLAVLQVNSKKFIELLKKKEVISKNYKKSLHFLKKVPERKRSHFFRGLIEGDGWMLSRRNSLIIGLAAKRIDFLKAFLTFARKFCQTKTIIRREEFSIANKTSFLIAKALYRNSGKNFLPRKKKIYLNFLRKKDVKNIR